MTCIIPLSAPVCVHSIAGGRRAEAKRRAMEAALAKARLVRQRAEPEPEPEPEDRPRQPRAPIEEPRPKPRPDPAALADMHAVVQAAIAARKQALLEEAAARREAAHKRDAAVRIQSLMRRHLSKRIVKQTRARMVLSQLIAQMVRNAACGQYRSAWVSRFACDSAPGANVPRPLTGLLFGCVCYGRWRP